MKSKVVVLFVAESLESQDLQFLLKSVRGKNEHERRTIIR